MSEKATPITISEPIKESRLPKWDCFISRNGHVIGRLFASTGNDAQELATEFSKCVNEYEALESENKLLREALQEIVNQVEYDHLDEYMDTQYNKAKAALKGESLEK